MRALKHALQCLQLAAVEGGSVPTLLLLSFGGAATAGAGTVTWGKMEAQQSGCTVPTMSPVPHEVPAALS